MSIGFTLPEKFDFYGDLPRMKVIFQPYGQRYRELKKCWATDCNSSTLFLTDMRTESVHSVPWGDICMTASMDEVWNRVGRPDTTFLTHGVPVKLSLPNGNEPIVQLIGANSKWSLFKFDGMNMKGTSQIRALIVGNAVSTVAKVEETGADALFPPSWPRNIAIKSSQKALELLMSLNVGV